MKKILISLCLLLLISSFAYGNLNAQQNRGSGSLQNVEVYVTDLELNSNTYNVGDTVTGTFVVHNVNSFDLNDLFFRISLTADYAEGNIPGVYYDVSEPIDIGFIRSGSTKDISFSYKLPATYSGEGFGVHIITELGSGQSLGWDDAFISIIGQTKPALDLVEASVNVKDQTFALNNGPTFYEGESASLNVVVNNPTNSDIRTNTKVKIYNRSVSGELLKEYYDGEVVFVAGENKSLEFVLPNFNYSPGVYLGDLMFIDEDGDKRLQTIQFRYIIGGEIATIHSVVSDAQSVTKGQEFGVNVTYTGSPVDIVNADGEQNISNGTLSLEVLDSKGKVVASDQKQLDNLVDETVAFSLKARSNANPISFVALITNKEGEVLSRFETDLPFDDLAGDRKMSANDIFISIIILGAVMVAILVWAFSKYKNIDHGLALFIAFTFIISALFFSGSQVVAVSSIYSNGDTAAKKDGSGEDIAYTPTGITVNSPKPPSVKVYEPNEAFDFQIGQVNAPACNNGWQKLYIYTQQKGSWTNALPQELNSERGSHDETNWVWWDNNGVQVFYTARGGNSRDHRSLDRVFTPSATGGYKAPSEEGDYRFYFYIYNDMQWSYRNLARYGVYLGYRDVRVEKPDKCPNLDKRQGDIPDGMIIDDNGNCVSKEKFSASCSAKPVSSKESDGGVDVLWRASAVNGSAPYTYEWGGVANGQTGDKANTHHKNVGSYEATVIVTDSLGNETSTASCRTSITKNNDDDDDGGDGGGPGGGGSNGTPPGSCPVKQTKDSKGACCFSENIKGGVCDNGGKCPSGEARATDGTNICCSIADVADDGVCNGSGINFEDGEFIEK